MQMRYETDGKTLTVFVEGRIDTSNVEEAGNEIDRIRKEAEGSLTLDAEKLNYISSAGLRLLLRLKKADREFKLVNVTPELYEILEMTGFTEMMTVEKGFRTLSVEGCDIIGEGAKGTVYRYNGDTIVKVYKNPDSLPDIKKERELARRAFVLGVPTAISFDIVKVGNSYGSVFELLNAKSYSELIREDEKNREKYVLECAELLRLIHNTEVKPGDMPDIKEFIFGWIDTAAPLLEKGEAEKLRKLAEDTPDRMNMLHCDFHTNNVMKQNGETLLIDMDTLSRGHPIFELANIYITYVGFGIADPTMVENFLGLPYGLTKEIFRIFIKGYLGTDDEKRIAEVTDKARLISDVRYIRHIIRRKEQNSEIGKKAIEICKKEITELLGRIDSLDF